MDPKLQSRLQELLREAIKAEKAGKGTLQRYDPSIDELEIVAQEGFTAEFLDHFKAVRPFDSSCCGRAFGVGTPIIISDVELDNGFRPNLKIARAAGFRSVKSVPIVSSKGEKLGVISTHFKEPKWNWDMKRLNDILVELGKVLRTA